jgi:proteic killer suppression protein
MEDTVFSPKEWQTAEIPYSLARVSCREVVGLSAGGAKNELLTDRIVYLYTIRVIKSYRHKGLERFAESGSKAGIQPKHADRLRRLLTALDVASVPQDMDAPGNKLHPLEGDLAHHWAVSVSGNWRLTFSFDGEGVIFVDYQDYH